MQSQFIAKQTNFKKYPEVLHFLEEMNKQAEILSLKNSFYDSPHGLSNSSNKSTAYDVCRLSTYAMKIEKFRTIVSTKFY